jgi:prephenate dehydratase
MSPSPLHHDASSAASSLGTATGKIAFQGAFGAYSDLACRTVYPALKSLPCADFETAFASVRDGVADLAMIPVENTIAGRVADIHHLLPHGGLHIVAEHFQRIEHHLLAKPGVGLGTLCAARSHVHAVGQCRNFLRRHHLQPIVDGDTAGAAKALAEGGDARHAVIASRLAAEIYGLDIVASNIEDADHNTTRFLVLAREENIPTFPPQQNTAFITSFVFRVRSVPAALYKALGGFATNGINMTKLESYLEASFTQAQFFAEVEGHPQQKSLRLALDELSFFAASVKVLGVYPAHPLRYNLAAA